MEDQVAIFALAMELDGAFGAVEVFESLHLEM
jgi:hypothetical protein